jgi:DNA-directed RNA polymerase subunit RPC12/RpoP
MSIECPYCGSLLEDPDDCNEPDKTYEYDVCPHCEKSFIFTLDYTVNYYPAKADCLNGAVHQEERTKTYPPQYSRIRCRMCGRERPMTEAEREAVVSP